VKGNLRSTSTSGFTAAAVGMCLETLLADPQRCDAAEFARVARASSAAGFRHVGLWLWRVAEMGIPTARTILDDAGVRVRLTECRIRWADGPDAAVEGLEEELDQVEALGAEMILAISKPTELDLSQAAEGFGALCERAAARGVRVTIEFIPCRALRDLATAWEVVRRSGAVNGGLDLDLMHWQNQDGGPDFDLLRRIPARHVHYVQVCDAVQPAPALDDYISTALRARPVPGDGIVDIPAFLRALGEMGADPFFAMEVFNADLVAGGPESMAARLRQAADALFD
jgi:sugar phosphate isomerase/epimerase